MELHLHCIVTGVDREGLTVRDRSGPRALRGGHVLWAAGVAAPPVAAALAEATGAATDRAGRIQVGHDLTIPGHPEISVVGDMMGHDDLPGVAEVAMQSGLYAGRRIRRRLSGERPTGAVPLPRPRLGGVPLPRTRRRLGGPAAPGRVPGWLVWLFIHIAFLTGYRNRVGAVLSWAVTFTRDARRERTFTTREIGSLHDLYAVPGAPEHRGVAS